MRYYFKIEYDKLDVANAFDVNYNPDVVNQEEHAHKIISILPGIPLLENGIMNRVPRLTPCRQMRWDSRSAVKRIRALSRLYDLHTLRLLRDTAKSHDVYFVTTYYSGPTHAALVEFRYKVMEELLKQGSHETVCGFAARDELPKPFNKYALPRSSRYDYLSRLAGSRVAIYVRGCWDSVSFKFGEYLALGLPVVGQTIARRWEKLDTIPFVADQFAFDAPREIAEEAFRMVQQSEKRRLLGEANAAVFDSLLTPEAVISDVLERLGLPTRSEDPRTKPRE
ncbi:MAG: hypothetical protein JXA57_12535 [Armatimonadetes bacterium]|nr:hypothetical protein [Armatimonadota bacterium]